MIRNAKDIDPCVIECANRAVVSDDIGARLRRARDQRGLSLHDAAARTKLSISVLQAIERNDFDSLPQGIYRKGYLRSLASEVGLDPQEMAADYDKQYGPRSTIADPSTKMVSAQPAVSDLTPSPPSSIVSIVVTIALAMGWFAWRDGVERPVPSDTSDELIGSTLLVDEAPGSTAIQRTSAPPEGIAARPQVDTSLRIEMAATGWCWVAAESDGERAMYRLVEPGERVVFEGRRMISLRLGDGGSVTLSINDGPPRQAGKDGEIVELKLTPDNVAALRGDVAEKVSGV